MFSRREDGMGGVGRGGEGMDEGQGMKPKWQSGSLCVGVGAMPIRLCVYMLYNCAVQLHASLSAALFFNTGGETRMDLHL